MNVFFEVSKVQQIDLLNNWLSVYDVFNLDEAVCCHNLRPDFLELLASPECYLQEYDFVDDFRDSWVIARKVKFKSVQLLYHTLQHNHGRERLPEAIGEHLTSLHLSFDRFLDDNGDEMPPIPAHLVLLEVSMHCPNVEHLTLSTTTLDGTLSVLVNTSTHLHHLTLRNCTDIPSSVLKAICSSQTLLSVGLAHCDFVDDAFKFTAKGCQSCISLSVANCITSDAEVKALIQYFPNVRNLLVHIYHGKSLLWLCRAFQKVQYVSIVTRYSVEAADTDLFGQYWQNVRKLTILHLSLPKKETHLAVCNEQCVLGIISACPNLQYLQLADPLYMSVYSGADTKASLPISAIVNTRSSSDVNMPVVSQLQILSTPALSEQGLTTIIRNCKQLQTLSINRATDGTIVEDDAAEYALHHINNTTIKSLILANCDKITTQHLLQLQTIDKLVLCRVGTNRTLTTAGIVSLAQQCKLRTLYIHACPGIDFNVVLHVLNSCPTIVNLKYYSEYDEIVSFPSPSTTIMRQLVKSSFPHLKIFDVKC